MHRVYSAQRGAETTTLVSEGARPWGRGRSKFAKIAVIAILRFGHLISLCKLSLKLRAPAVHYGLLSTHPDI